MIYTVTFSPAIDYVIHMDDLKLGATNRTLTEDYYFGGKGINVSTILTELGIDNTAMGFVSGFTGKALEKGLETKGIKTDFVQLDSGITRINIKIKMDQETEINAQGPSITKEKLQELLEKLDVLKADDILVISGNVPNTLPQDIYQVMIGRLEKRNIRLVVDATGELLKSVLKYRPFLVKPNKQELEDLLDITINSDEELKAGAEKLQNMGAVNVLVSLGKDGAYLLCENGESHHMKAIPQKAKNTVGAGDSMVAGFLAGYLAEENYKEALKLGIAAGSATACSEGLAPGAIIKDFYKKI